MALLLKNQNETGAYGEPLTELYVRVEPALIKTGDKISFELYFYNSKSTFKAGGKVIKAGKKYTVDYTVTNDGYILYGLHQLLVQHLLTLTEGKENTPLYQPEDIEIVDVDAPA
jgi:hypothetical protein